MTDIEFLQKERIRLWKEVKRSCANMKRAQKLCTSLTQRYQRDKTAHEDIDRQLAMQDGRLKLVTKDTKPVPKLTKAQILEIISELEEEEAVKE